MHLGGQASWVYAIGALPLATVFAIEFTSPIWTAVLAVLFLGEHMNRGRAVMLALGLAGVLVILRPGLGVFQPAALVMLAGSLFFAIQFIGTKQLSATESPHGGAVLDVGDPDAGLPGGRTARLDRARDWRTCRGSSPSASAASPRITA